MRRVVSAVVVAALLTAISTHSIDAQEDVPHFIRTVVAALGSGDESEIRGLLRFTTVPCELDPEPLSGYPRCAEGEPKGTRVDTFPTGSCEGFFARADDLPQYIIDDLTLPNIEVVDVYRLPSDTPSSLGRGEYVAIVTGIQELATNNGTQSYASAVYLGDGGITRLSRGCASTVESFVDGLGLGEPLNLGQANALPGTGTYPASGGPWPSGSVMLAVMGALLLTGGLACKLTSGRVRD